MRPKIAIICGSGLGPLADMVANPERVQFGDIPHFPATTGK
jgi:purine-nucleoside phosphorylase